MGKHWIWIAAVLCCVGSLKAQEAGKGVRTWEQGRLSWNDFSKRKGNEAQQAEFKGFLTYTLERRKTNDTIVYQAEIKAFMDRDSSWADPNAMTAQELRYQQVVFDLLKLQSLRLQLEARKIRKPNEMDSCLQHGFDRYMEEVRLFQKESNNGKDSSVIQQWEVRMQQQLQEALPPTWQTPPFSPAAFGFGAHVHAGSNLFAGNLAKLFRPRANVGIGFDFSLGRSMLLLNANLGGIKVRPDSMYIQKEKWASSDHVELYQMGMAYGFRLTAWNKWQFTPFVGYGITEISTIAGQGDGMKHKKKTGGWMGGLCVDYALRTSMNLTPNYLPAKECQTFSLKAKCYVTQADFTRELNGLTINFALAVNVFDRFIRLR